MTAASKDIAQTPAESLAARRKTLEEAISRELEAFHRDTGFYVFKVMVERPNEYGDRSSVLANGDQVHPERAGFGVVVCLDSVELATHWWTWRLSPEGHVRVNERVAAEVRDGFVVPPGAEP